MANIAIRRSIISASLIVELGDLFGSGESLVVVGPRHSGKSWLIGSVLVRLQSAGIEVIKIALQGETALSEEEVLRRASKASAIFANAHSLDGFFEVARHESERQRRPLVLVIEDLDGVERETARKVLRGVRVGVSSRWLCVAITGESHIFDLVTGPSSEFNCSNEFILQGVEEELYIAAGKQWAQRLAVELEHSDQCLARLCELTAGNIFVLRQLLYSVVDKSLDKTSEEPVKLTLADIEGEIDHIVSLGAYGSAYFQRAGELIDANPDCWANLLDLIQGGSPVIAGQAPDFLELAGVAFGHDGHLEFSSPLMKRFVLTHFEPRRRGDLEALSGDFESAFASYLASGVRPPRPSTFQDGLIVTLIVRRLCRALRGSEFESLRVSFISALELILGFSPIAYMTLSAQGSWNQLSPSAVAIPAVFWQFLINLASTPGSCVLLGQDVRACYGVAVALPDDAGCRTASSAIVAWGLPPSRYVSAKRMDLTLEICEAYATELERHRSAVAKLKISLSDRWDPRQLVECMRPEGWSGLYVVGTFDKRITFYTQQARALTLVRALFDIKDLKQGSEIGIIGAGAAGLTAAVAAARKGCRVTLFERRDAVLPIQAPASHRFLHPRIYDWPEPNSLDDDARLPFLSWKADNCDVVVRHLRREFEQAAGPVEFCSGSVITQIRHADDGGRIQVVGNEGLIERTFQTVVLCVGFGLEVTHGDAGSYWSGDTLSGPFDQRQRVLVSGAGDGGLIDVARSLSE